MTKKRPCGLAVLVVSDLKERLHTGGTGHWESDRGSDAHGKPSPRRRRFSTASSSPNRTSKLGAALFLLLPSGPHRAKS